MVCVVIGKINVEVKWGGHTREEARIKAARMNKDR